MAKEDVDLDLFDDGPEDEAFDDTRIPSTENTDGFEEAPSGDPPVREVRDQVSKIEQTQLEQAQIMRLLADPAVMEVLKARQEGRPVSITEKTPPPPEVELQEPDYETASTKDIMSYMQKSLLTQVGKMVDEKLNKVVEPLGEKVQEVSKFANNAAQERLNAQVQAARERFSDLDTYGNEMIQLQRKPELSVEELYLVCKRRAGNGKAPDRRIESERPSVSSARSSAKSQERVGNGVADYKALLDRALNKD